MNCFDWQNRASEYLDGSLILSSKREADAHLDQCSLCQNRLRHYRTILQTLTLQPRHELPVAIRKSPLTPKSFSKNNFKPKALLRAWTKSPWYLRIPLEGLLLALGISLGISAGPRIKLFYETQIEKSLNEYSEVTNSDSESGSGARLLRGNLSPEYLNSAGDDFAGSEDDSDNNDNEETPTGDSKNLKAASKDTWRFNLKTESPNEIRKKIINIFVKLKIPESTRGIGGIEAPGGIQFDLYVPVGVIGDLKQELEKIAPAPPKELEDSPFGETFTWYKRKSKIAAPPGQTHVVIWLAQI